MYSGIDQIFIAPELLATNGSKITEKADSWSVGAILYVLITGGNFNSNNKSDQVNFDFQENAWQNYSIELKDFIASCLIRDPLQRPSTCQLMSSTFFQLYNESILQTDREIFQNDSGEVSCYRLQIMNIFNDILTRNFHINKPKIMIVH